MRYTVHFSNPVEERSWNEQLNKEWLKDHSYFSLINHYMKDFVETYIYDIEKFKKHFYYSYEDYLNDY